MKSGLVVMLLVANLHSGAVRTYPDVVPSVKSLDEEELELMSEALEVHKDWGYSKELD